MYYYLVGTTDCRLYGAAYVRCTCLRTTVPVVCLHSAWITTGQHTHLTPQCKNLLVCFNVYRVVYVLPDIPWTWLDNILDSAGGWAPLQPAVAGALPVSTWRHSYHALPWEWREPVPFNEQ
jgi:hypothetical protein